MLEKLLIAFIIALIIDTFLKNNFFFFVNFYWIANSYLPKVRFFLCAFPFIVT